MNIIHITKWYPNEFDPQLGIFVQKQIHKGLDFAHNVVIAIIPTAKVPKLKVTVSKQEHCTEIIGYYNAKPGSLWNNYRNRQRIQVKVLQQFLELNFRPDLVHCHAYDGSIDFAQKFFNRIPRVFSAHWSGFLNGKFESFSKRKQAKIINQINTCEKVACVSPQLKHALKKYGVNRNISIIPNVIDQGTIKTDFNIPLKMVVIADLVDEVKNISGVIAAFKGLEDKHATLTIVGDGPDRHKLENLAQDERITFEGRKDNEWVLGQLHQFDVLIVNSFSETFSMITAEALLCGVPVISTKCGGPEQFIKHNINGWLVDVDNTDQLKTVMEESTQKLVQLSPNEIRKSIIDQVNLEEIKNQFRSFASN